MCESICVVGMGACCNLLRCLQIHGEWDWLKLSSSILSLSGAVHVYPVFITQTPSTNKYTELGVECV